MDHKQVALIGASLGWGAQQLETEQGPQTLKAFGLEAKLQQAGIDCSWFSMVEPPVSHQELGHQPFSKRLPWILETQREVGQQAAKALQENRFPVVLGGDHSIAMGTWSGVISHLHAAQEFGLLWIDAHMDAHTHKTTPSEAVHGMPVAALLGYGEQSFVDLASAGAKINPKHLVLIGIRSFESGEKVLLEKLGVRVFYMEEIERRGLKDVCIEALEIVKQAPKGFGASVDLDAFDPSLIPGVGTPEPNGLSPDEFLPLFHEIVSDPAFKALEVTEFNPVLDQQDATAKHVLALLKQLKQPS